MSQTYVIRDRNGLYLETLVPAPAPWSNINSVSICWTLSIKGTAIREGTCSGNAVLAEFRVRSGEGICLRRTGG